MKALHLLFGVILGIGLYVITATAFAGDRESPGGSIAAASAGAAASASASAAGTAQSFANPVAAATGGTGGAGGNVSSRTTAIGLSAAANSATCLAPIFAGILQMEDATCVAIRHAAALESLGYRAAAKERLCSDERVASAMKRAGESCGE